jgi:hypothetical protein
MERRELAASVGGSPQGEGGEHGHGDPVTADPHADGERDETLF